MQLPSSKEENYFDHDVGIGIISRGETIESCFANAAYNLFSLVTDLSHVHQLQILTFEFDEAETATAFTIWLNTLLVKADQHNMIFNDFRLKHEGSHWYATVAGERWPRNVTLRMQIKDIKLTVLGLMKAGYQWEARCVLEQRPA